MTQAQENKLFFMGGYFNTNLPQDQIVMRILHFSVQDMEEGTHYSLLEKGKRPYHFESFLGNSYGTVREQTYCPFNKVSKFPLKKTYYVWYLDLNHIDERTNEPMLKWIAVSYTNIKKLEGLMGAMNPGAPYFQLPVTYTRTANPRVEYNFYPSQYPRDGFDINGWLAHKQVTSLPPIFGPANTYPPVINVTVEEAENIVNHNIMPWARKTAQPPVSVGTGAYGAPVGNQYVAPAPVGAPVQANPYQPPVNPYEVQGTTPPVHGVTHSAPTPTTTNPYGANPAGAPPVVVTPTPSVPMSKTYGAVETPTTYVPVPDLTGDPHAGLDLTSPDTGIVHGTGIQSDQLPLGYQVQEVQSLEGFDPQGGDSLF